MLTSKVELVINLMIFLNNSFEGLIIMRTFEIILIIIETFEVVLITIKIFDIVGNIEKSLLGNLEHKKDFV